MAAVVLPAAGFSIVSTGDTALANTLYAFMEDASCDWG
jgi:hypothetical protein